MYDIYADDDGPDEVRMTIDQLKARNARWDDRRAERVRKGRPAYRTVVQQWDATTRRTRPATVAPDPMFDLYVARDCYRKRLPDSERAGLRYGTLRARVTSPVCLPKDRPHA